MIGARPLDEQPSLCGGARRRLGSCGRGRHRGPGRGGARQSCQGSPASEVLSWGRGIRGPRRTCLCRGWRSPRSLHPRGIGTAAHAILGRHCTTPDNESRGGGSAKNPPPLLLGSAGPTRSTALRRSPNRPRAPKGEGGVRRPPERCTPGRQGKARTPSPARHHRTPPAGASSGGSGVACRFIRESAEPSRADAPEHIAYFRP